MLAVDNVLHWQVSAQNAKEAYIILWSLAVSNYVQQTSLVLIAAASWKQSKRFLQLEDRSMAHI